nr:lipopolysaccharide biosynthesis protein [Pseudoclavibacter helvolus]
MRRNALLTLGGQWGKYALQIGTFVVLARLLTPSDYGVFNMALAFTGLVAVVGDFGLSLSALRERTLSEAEKSGLFWLNAAIGIVLAIIMYALATPIAAFYGDERVMPIVQIIGACFVVSGLTVQYKVEFMRQDRFGALALIEVVSQALAFGIAIAMAVNGFGYWALVAQSVLGYVFLLLVLVSTARWRPGLAVKGTRWKHHLTFGSNTFTLQIVNYVSTNVDTAMLGSQVGAAAVGLYSRAFQIVRLPLQQLVAPLTKVVLTDLSRIASSDEKAFRLEKLHRLLAISLVPLLALLAGTADPGISLIFGHQWAGAAVVVQVLAIGGAFQAIGYVYYWAFVAEGKTGALLLAELPGRVVMIGLVVIWAQLGIVAVAWAYVIGQALVLAGSSLVAASRLNLKTRTVWSSSVLGISIGALIFVLTLCANFVSQQQEFGALAKFSIQIVSVALPLGVVLTANRSLRSKLIALLGGVRK